MSQIEPETVDLPESDDEPEDQPEPEEDDEEEPVFRSVPVPDVPGLAPRTPFSGLGSASAPPHTPGAFMAPPPK